LIKKALEQHRQAEQSEQERKQREKAERLARNFDDLLAIIKELNQKGVIFKSLQENLVLDSSKPGALWMW